MVTNLASFLVSGAPSFGTHDNVDLTTSRADAKRAVRMVGPSSGEVQITFCASKFVTEHSGLRNWPNVKLTDGGPSVAAEFSTAPLGRHSVQCRVHHSYSPDNTHL